MKAGVLPTQLKDHPAGDDLLQAVQRKGPHGMPLSFKGDGLNLGQSDQLPESVKSGRA
jgi:hypothetical protein